MNTDIETAYKDVERLLFKLAWDTHHRYSIPFDECLSECNMAFVKAFNWRHDPSKGTKFSTTCCNIAKWRLRSLVIGRAEADPVLEVNEELLEGLETPPAFHATDLVSDLGEDVQSLLQLLLDVPKDLLGVTATPKQHLRNIKRHMVEVGHEESSVDAAIAALRQRLQEVWA